MKKVFFICLTLLVLLACTEKVSDDSSSDQVKNLFDEKQAAEVKKIIDKQLKVNEKNLEEKEEEPKAVEALPWHECAMFTQEEGVALCDTSVTAAEYFEHEELHNTCNQQFRSAGMPYNYVQVRSLRYHDKSEADKKFKIDFGAYQGVYDSKNKNIFWSETENSKLGEFQLGKRIVRISETPKNGCVNFEKMVRTAFARGG